jgi:pimeloyl-ACP methyl ester carboxylesterase
VTIGALAYERFYNGRTNEWLVRLGDPRTPPILFVPPLFEELNRTRALIVAVMRRVAAEGNSCWLPDLRGTGESLLAVEEVTWEEWRHDVSAVAEHIAKQSGKRPVMASLRGGCLIDDGVEAVAWWRFAPATGAALARDLDRASLAGGAEWAGYPAAPAMREALRGATAANVTPLRMLRLETDAGPADHKVAGPALWRRSEPGSSEALAKALAADLIIWSRACAAS